MIDLGEEEEGYRRSKCGVRATAATAGDKRHHNHDPILNPSVG